MGGWGSHRIRASVYIVNWVASAWAILKTKAEFIRKAFVSTGWLLAKDGSENHLVKLKNWFEAYDFPRPSDDEYGADRQPDDDPL